MSPGFMLMWYWTSLLMSLMCVSLILLFGFPGGSQSRRYSPV